MERACLRLVARRLSSKQIAVELGIAKTSVDTYCNRARAKLEVADRYEAARLVVAQGEAADIRPGLTLVRPAADRAPEAAADAAPRRRLDRRLAVLILAAVAAALALASLMSGITALQDLHRPSATGSRR
jgi:DNA-binding CsgD family transcriptional regulator